VSFTPLDVLVEDSEPKLELAGTGQGRVVGPAIERIGGLD
jgi:hypothetical protein